MKQKGEKLRLCIQRTFKSIRIENDVVWKLVTDTHTLKGCCKT